jgi:uncharacterized protein YbaR (Trm112 family)
MPYADQQLLTCPVCREPRSVAETTLLERETDWSATGAFSIHRPPGWSVDDARTNDLRWACIPCFKAGRALEGHPAVQTWCDHNPYFAFIDAELCCEDCGQKFVFAATEQRFWYETLKFWVQSRPKQCIPCRRARRARGRAAREDQTRRQQRLAEPGSAKCGENI